MYIYKCNSLLLLVILFIKNKKWLTYPQSNQQLG